MYEIRSTLDAGVSQAAPSPGLQLTSGPWGHQEKTDLKEDGFWQREGVAACSCPQGHAVS